MRGRESQKTRDHAEKRKAKDKASCAEDIHLSPGKVASVATANICLGAKAKNED